MAQAWIPAVKAILKKSVDLAHFTRCVVWYLKSTKEYTKAAFVERAKVFKSFDDVDISGKSFLIFGASGTLGTAVTTYLAKKDGVTIYAVYHNQEHGDNLLNLIKPITHANSKIVPQKIDMCQPQEIYTFINEFIKSGKDVHVLINCAGVMPDDQEKDSKGTLNSFIVHVISPYLIYTKFSEYMSSLPATEFKRRIINCTCGCILTVNVHLMDLELKKFPFKALFHFSHEMKLIAAILYELAHKNTTIQYSNVIPGWVKRNLSSENIPEIAESMRSDLRTPEEGADSILWLAISKECLSFPAGEIFLDRQQYKLSYISIPNKLRSTAFTVAMKNFQNILARYPELTSAPIISPSQPASSEGSKSTPEASKSTQEASKSTPEGSKSASKVSKSSQEEAHSSSQEKPK